MYHGLAGAMKAISAMHLQKIRGGVDNIIGKNHETLSSIIGDVYMKSKVIRWFLPPKAQKRRIAKLSSNCE